MKKELSIEEKAKAYDEAIENGKQILNTPYTAHWDTMKEVVEHLLPELKESEDERIRKDLLEHCKNQAKPYIQTGNECPQIQSWIAWLEKQGEKDNISIDFVLGYLGIKPAYKDGNAWCILLGDNIQEGICGFGDTKEEALIAFIKELIEKQGTSAKLSEEEQNRFAKGVLTSCASLFINYLDAHKYEGKMCVSNGECEDIENAFQNGMWDKLHRYYCKYIEKQSNNPQGKSALEAVMEEKIDNQNCVKPVDEVEIPFGAKDSELIEATYFIPKGFHAEIDGDKVVIKKGEQKPAWSEDDEEMFKYAIGHFEIQKRNSIEGGLRKISMQEFIDWIKYLRDRLM